MSSCLNMVMCQRLLLMLIQLATSTKTQWINWTRLSWLCCNVNQSANLLLASPWQSTLLNSMNTCISTTLMKISSHKLSFLQLTQLHFKRSNVSIRQNWNPRGELCLRNPVVNGNNYIFSFYIYVAFEVC